MTTFMIVDFICKLRQSLSFASLFFSKRLFQDILIRRSKLLASLDYYIEDARNSFLLIYYKDN